MESRVPSPVDVTPLRRPLSGPDALETARGPGVCRAARFPAAPLLPSQCAPLESSGLILLDNHRPVGVVCPGLMRSAGSCFAKDLKMPITSRLGLVVISFAYPLLQTILGGMGRQMGWPNGSMGAADSLRSSVNRTRHPWNSSFEGFVVIHLCLICG